MQTTEIRMITDLDSAVPQSLDFNFEEVKDWLAENLTAYRSMVVTEDALAPPRPIRRRSERSARQFQNSGSRSRSAIWNHTTPLRRK